MKLIQRIGCKESIFEFELTVKKLELDGNISSDIVISWIRGNK